MATYIKPCNPLRRKEPPIGPNWSHEVKFDGYRVQLHKAAGDVVVYSRRGADFTRRVGRGVVEAVRALRCSSCILDGELIAIDATGVPTFEALHQRATQPLAVVVFDILWLDGTDLRERPLAARRIALAPFLSSAGPLLPSETFDDPVALLKACEQHGLEGIVSKRLDSPYRSGTSRQWIKVKTVTWLDGFRERHRLFQRPH